jgi:hypothetical protein
MGFIKERREPKRLIMGFGSFFLEKENVMKTPVVESPLKGVGKKHGKRGIKAVLKKRIPKVERKKR